MCQDFVPNHMHSLWVLVIVPKHVTEDCPDLLKKWEEKKAHCNMVTTEPHGNQKKDEEVDVWGDNPRWRKDMNGL
jgi:hypothetical protein